jgi:ATP-binding cassette subfamily F protein 3
VSALSGGERGRVGLAAPLAAPADLLLLDEPTNHLDLDTIRWLTDYLGNLGETVIVISHDRAFLDDTVDHVLHVSAGSAEAYRGGYSAFVTQRAERELTRGRELQRQQSFIAKEEDYIRRNIAGQNTKQAKGRRKRLERLPRLSAPPGEGGTMALRLETFERGGDRVVHAEKLRVAIGGRTLVDNVTVTALRTEVVALVGPNGIGKTTLLSTLLGAIPPAAGEVRIGSSVTPAWYRQDLAGVPLTGTIYEVIQDLRPLWTRGQIQGHLGAFGFSGDEVQRMTSSLSGGERARVALAMITLSHANLLVLDEPTNHLDVESIEALEDAFEDYEGTVMLVSHDRAFLRELATRVWAIADGKLEDFPGPFVEWEAAQVERTRARSAAEAAAVSAKRTAERAASKRAAAKPADSGAAVKAARRDAETRERAANEAESEVRTLEAQLADPALYEKRDGVKRSTELTRQLNAARAKHDAAVAAWAEAVEREERLKNA